MAKSASLFTNAALNLFLIPQVPLATRTESWDKTVELNYDYERIDLGRTTHLYFTPALVSRLQDLQKKLLQEKKIVSVELCHKSSYSGMPYLIEARGLGPAGNIQMQFDGLIFFFSVDKLSSIASLDELKEVTESAYAFRNDCFSIVKDFNLQVYRMHSPFWDMEISEIGKLGLSTESEYPAFLITLNDPNYRTLTNLGDKMVGSSGKDYRVYFSENKKSIRERICHDMIIDHDLHGYSDFLSQKNRFAISSNQKLIDSLKGVPGTILTFFRRNKQWKSLRDIPAALLDMEAILPKHMLFYEALKELLEHRFAYINVPVTMWLSGEEPDKELRTQREVPGFFRLSIEDSKVKVEDEKAMRPVYGYIQEKVRTENETLSKNVESAIVNLNTATTLYSTNFGFDALWIAVIALIVAIVPIATPFDLAKNAVLWIIQLVWPNFC